ncbi:hypothetical protein MVEN_01345500 [Mycena venus]|uniref:Maestro/Maestro-like HEAT-repeats domain-containing protein n=1 Tax=Mycena venus TaxID=2733690 RepID=A0A8H6Y231_9AGAR|nr:hypothetical protein MVEN_01345500 [Mycena venus]
MLPLNRQDTRPSIHSWWSDSNPGLQGPTINLHAAAKPLMRRIYNRQALQLIKKNRGSPLSTTTLEIYLSYLPWKFISSSTKDVILEELMARSESEADAGAMVVSSVFNIFLAQMLESPDMGVQIFACTLLASLVKFECTMPAILELGICEQLMSSLRAGIPRSAIYVALSQIARWSDGAQAVVDAKALDDVKELLKSPNPQVRYQTCELVNALASHDSTAPAILELSTCKELESLLCQEDSEVLEWAIRALSQTAHSLYTPRVIVDAGALDLIVASLESLSPTIRRQTCQLVGGLASHASTAAAILALKPFQTLVSLLSDKDSEIARGAAHALSQIGRSSDGTQVIVDARVLDFILGSLESPSHSIRKWTCVLVGNLAYNKSTRASVLALKPFQALMPLLSDKDSEVVDGAAFALSQIAFSVDGAQAILDTGTLGHILRLLESPSHSIRRWTCVIVGNLVYHEFARASILALKPFQMLVTLLSDKDSGVINGASHVLSNIADSLDGAEAIVNAGALDHVLALLQSRGPNIRKWMWILAGNLASHESTRAAVLALKPFQTLATSLSDKDSEVVEAVTALSQITRSLDGLQAIVNAGALDRVLALFQSRRDPNIRKWTWILAGNLASHESTRTAVLASKSFQMLVTSLSDEESEVVEEAVTALSQIARSLDGSQAIVNAGGLGHFSPLLQSPSPRIQKQICRLLGNLAFHDSASTAVLALKPLQMLVTLLSDKDSEVVEEAVCALSNIAHSLDAAQAIFDAGGLGNISALLQSPSPRIQKWICRLLGNLAFHDSASAAVLALKYLQMLVTLLSDEEPEVVEEAAYALSNIADSLDAARAIVDAGGLGHVSALLQSPIISPRIQKWTCRLLGNLAFRDPASAAVLALKPLQILVKLLSGEDSEVVEKAAYALANIADSLDAAKAIVDAGGFSHILVLLRSPYPSIRKWTCILAGNLASHESTIAAVLALKPFRTLVTLLSHKDFELVDRATYALSQIARPLDGAQAILDAGALDHISRLLESPSPSIRKWACKIVERLAKHDSTVLALLKLGPFDQLLSCLRKPATGAGAIFALSALSERPDGVAALAKIERLREKLQVLVLLKVLPDAEMKVRIQTILDNLDRYEAAADAGIGIAL